jgi:hypothetical protein
VAFCQFRQKLNRRFDQHAAANLRDTERVETVMRCPNVDLHPVDIREDIANNIIASTPRHIIKVTGVRDNTFGVHKDTLKIGNKIYCI